MPNRVQLGASGARLRPYSGALHIVNVTLLDVRLAIPIRAAGVERSGVDPHVCRFRCLRIEVKEPLKSGRTVKPLREYSL